MAKKKSKASKPKASTAGPAPKQLAPSEKVDQVVRCAENVALLDILSRSLPIIATPIPAPKARSKGNAESTRQLSWEQEDMLVKGLAFLSGVSDSPNHIMAVCIQELPKQGGCEIILAVNKTAPDSAQGVLEKAQRGLQLVLGRLRGVSPTSSNEVKRAVRGAVFNDIIALSRERILSRMRSSKYKVSSQKRQKCFVGLLLRDALNSPWHRKAREQKLDMTERDLENHGRRIKGLLEAMEAYEASDPTLHEDLAKLVRKVAHFTQSTPLRDLLATLTDAEMHQCSRERLVNCLNKIARYRDIAKFLCREAEGIPMLRNATVRSLKLPAEAFARSTTGREAYDGTVASALDKLSSKDKFLWKHDLPPWLQTFLEATPDAAFASEINRTLRESKIHAEIQILAHYETVASTVVRPRVIASSKDACYLCHAFISLHGQYRVPKTHGKLYRGWRLPAARTLAPLQQHLNKFLEQQVRTTVARLRGTEGIPSKRPPNESTLFPLAVSASLLSSMRNLSIVSNHSRLDLTAAAPAVENPSQVSYRALGTRVSGALLLPSGHAAGVDGDPGPCTTDHGSHGDEDSQENNSVASNSTRKDGSVNNTNGPSALIERATESITRAPAPDASPPELYNHSSSHVDDKSAKTASSCRPRTEHRGDAATVVLQPSASAANDWWFRYQNVDVFVDESSAKFSHRRLGKSAAVEALLRGGENVLRDVRSLAVGTEIRIPKDTDGRAYFACGDEAFMIDTRHEEAM